MPSSACLQAGHLLLATLRLPLRFFARFDAAVTLSFLSSGYIPLCSVTLHTLVILQFGAADSVNHAQYLLNRGIEHALFGNHLIISSAFFVTVLNVLQNVVLSTLGQATNGLATAEAQMEPLKAPCSASCCSRWLWRKASGGATMPLCCEGLSSV